MMTTKHIVSTIAGLLGLGALGAAAFASTRPAGSPSPTPPGTDPDSSISISSFVIKDGQCYYAAVYANGTSSSTLVPMSFCMNTDPAPNPGFPSTVTPPQEGMGRSYVRR